MCLGHHGEPFGGDFVDDLLARVKPVEAAVGIGHEVDLGGILRGVLRSIRDGLRARGHRNVSTISHNSELAPLIHEVAKPGDVVICLGAGNITQWAYSLPGELDELTKRSAG